MYYGMLGGWLSITINIILFIFKAILGFVSGSVALIADAFHTLSDLGTSFIVIFSFYISEKPSDARHPFGHGRAEFVSAIIIATLLAVTAFELLKYSISRIVHPVMFIAPWWIIGFVFFTVILKEGLAIFTMRLSKKIHSQTLRADAYHHHQDAVSSLLVIIAFILSQFNMPYFDGPAGVIISLIIFYSAFEIAKTPIDHILGVAPDEDLLTKIERIALSFSKVQGVHDIIIHQYGQVKVISLHIEIGEHLSLNEAHYIAEEVDRKLRESIQAHVTVHVDPVMRRTPLYQKVEEKLIEFCKNTNLCESFHDLRLLGENNRFRLVVDLVTKKNSNKKSDQQLIQDLRNFVLKNIPEVTDVLVKVEPKFSVSRRSRHNPISPEVD